MTVKLNQTITYLPFLCLLLLFGGPGFAQDRGRDSWQQPTAIMDSLGITAGMIIGEAGAGEGYFTFHLARRVGPAGRVYANDIDRRALEVIEERMEEEAISNIVTVVGEIDNPLFPHAELDMVVIMNAFHDFAEPVEWMNNVIPSMKPRALLVIIDRDPEKMGTGWDHFMTKERVLATMEETDFSMLRVITFLERDNMYLYELKDSHEETTEHGGQR